jgi:DNA-binding transcriptional LysR family regulator
LIYNPEVVDVHLRRLRAFVVVAEELHFTRAAERLIVAQQALSKQIADLEREVGTALFERTSRKVELTAAGEAFLGMAREILARFDRGIADVRHIGQGGHATLRVGFIAGAALELTPYILGEFTNRHPDTGIELHEFDLSDPTAGLASGKTDVAFIRLPSATGDLVTVPLFTEPCVLAVSAGHRLGGRDQVSVADLGAEPVAIGRTNDQAWRNFWTLAEGRTSRPANTLVETSSQSEEMEVVAAGMACTVTPAAAVRYMPHPGIRFIPISDYHRSTVAVAHQPDSTNHSVPSFVLAAMTARDRETGIVESIENPFAPAQGADG